MDTSPNSQKEHQWLLENTVILNFFNLWLNKLSLTQMGARRGGARL